jgi:hypothetical protein
MGDADETAFLPPVARRDLSGAERLLGTADKTVLDYWRWAHSDCQTAKSVSEARLKTMTTSVRYSDLKARIDDALAGITFVPTATITHEPTESTEELTKERATRVYLVAERKTRAHPVVVNARNYEEAHLLARADETIASLGTHISAFELSKSRLEAALSKGAIDLRFARPPKEQVKALDPQ